MTLVYLPKLRFLNWKVVLSNDRQRKEQNITLRVLYAKGY